MIQRRSPCPTRRACLQWAAVAVAGRALPLGAAQLRVGFSNDMPPYVFEAEQRGLDIDLVMAACRLGGLSARPLFAPMGRLPQLLIDGAVDAIATTQPRSGLQAHFSQPYIVYRNWAVALAARKLDIRRIADLGRYSISTFQRARQYLGEEFDRMAASNPHYREEARQVVRNNLLFLGRIDVVVGDRRIIEHYNRMLEGDLDTRQALTWYPLFPPTPYTVAFRDAGHCDAFDRGLEALRRGGEYAAIERQYATGAR